MQYLLNDQKIADSSANIDRDELNTALNLAFYFTKKRICSLRIKDVYDGQDILPLIVFDIKKPPRETEESLKSILTSHIDYLQKKHLIGQEVPLCPGYFGNNGEKQLQRHIQKFSNHRDFNALKKALRADQYKKLTQENGDSRSRVKKISTITGKSVRTIVGSLYKAPVSSTPFMKRGMKFRGDDQLRFLMMLDELVVLPEIQALNEESIYEIINKSFEIIERAFKGTAIEQMKFYLITVMSG